MSDVITIGIAGGTGSGKTTITKLLRQRFGEAVSVVYHDNYYKAHNDMTYEERSRINYDCPDAFDTDLLIEDLPCPARRERDSLPGVRLQCAQPQRADGAGAPRPGGDCGGHPDFPERGAVRSAGH